MEDVNQTKLWKDVLDLIKISVSGATFSTWFSKTFITSIQNKKEGGQTIEIGCHSSFVAAGLEKRYFELIQNCLNQVTGVKNNVLFRVKQRGATNTNKEPLFFDASTSPNSDDGEFELRLQQCRIRPGFTFENFAVSGTNQMAHAAAEAVVKKPGNAYNPLFIWGGVGVGKTHLMLAVANKLLRERPDMPALYCMGDEFITEIVQAIRNKTTAAFKNRYRRLKLLLVDDVQFIAGKDTVQEEFFHTFNVLQREGGQVILTSDKPPLEIHRLEPRLKSRFEAGLVVDITPPDFELRTAITLIKAKEQGIDLPMDGAQLIAGNLDSPRKIEGFIVKLCTFIRVSHVNEEGITASIEKLFNQTNGEVDDFKKTATPSLVINAVSQYFSLGKRRLLGESRIRSTALPRQILMYLLRKDLGLQFEEVGRLLGRDHTTVMYGVEKIVKELSTNHQLRGDIMGIKKSISV